METARTNIQSALNNLSKWTRRKGFMISLEKTIAMHICRKRNHDHPQIRLNGQILEVKNTHKILGITFDNRLTWKAYITGAKAKAGKRMNVLRSLAGTNWGADQGMLPRIIEIFILSTLEYGSIAYGSPTDELESIHNRGLRIALGAFCVCKTTNILCESGYDNLDERRRRKLTNIALHVAENDVNYINHSLSERRRHTQPWVWTWVRWSV
jgi:hypothetical protein